MERRRGNADFVDECDRDLFGDALDAIKRHVPRPMMPRPVADRQNVWDAAAGQVVKRVGGVGHVSHNVIMASALRVGHASSPALCSCAKTRASGPL